MAWYIRFIPREGNGISVSINNEHWTTWHSSDGDVKWKLPPKWVNNDSIHVYGAAIPNGQNVQMKVYWDNEERQNMEFDADEDHDVDH